MTKPVPPGDECAFEQPHWPHPWGWRKGGPVSCPGKDGPNKVHVGDRKKR